MAKINVTFTTKEREFMKKVFEDFLHDNADIEDVRLCIRVADKINPPEEELDEEEIKMPTPKRW
jgi:hypothetical protein